MLLELLLPDRGKVTARRAWRSRSETLRGRFPRIRTRGRYTQALTTRFCKSMTRILRDPTVLLSVFLIATVACVPVRESEPVPTYVDLPDGVVGVSYNEPFVIANAAPPYVHALSAGTLPPGISVQSSSFSGTPTQGGLFLFQFSTTDSRSTSRTFVTNIRLLISDPNATLSLLSRSLRHGETSKTYSDRVFVNGGSAPITFAVTAGTLPKGIRLDSDTGMLSGTPTVAALYPITIRATDSKQNEARRPLFLSIASRTTGGSIHASLAANRTSGVAPLSVFFDASATTASGVTKPFHHLACHWDFDNPEGRRPDSTGPVAAHVFDQPGMYNVKLTVEGTDGTVRVLSKIITVEDPDSVFFGNKTVCFSNDTNFTGAPADALKVTTRSYDTALKYYGTAKRLLFKRGHSFDHRLSQDLKANGPSILGAFGAVGNRDERGIASNAPIINTLAAYDAVNLVGKDIRVMDLSFNDVVKTGVYYRAVHTPNGAEYALIYRLNISGYERSILMGTGKQVKQESNTVADCVVTGRGVVASAYIGGRRLAILGNYMNNADVSSHVLRVTFADRCSIDSNQLLYPEFSKHCIKLLQGGPNYPEGSLTQRVVISRNTMNCRSGWMVTLGPQNRTTDERLKDILVEKNIMVAENGTGVAFVINCADVTVRNNVILNKGTGDYFAAILVERRGIEPIPSGVEIHNNTYANPSNSLLEDLFIRVSQHTGAVLCSNNLTYAPKNTNFILKKGAASATLAGNLHTRNPGFVDINNMDFSLKGTSPAIGKGVPAPVLDDMRGWQRRRLPSMDVGAASR